MASGAFDAWSGSEGYSANYSNHFRIDVVEVETGIGEVKGESGTNGRRKSKVKAIYDLQGRKVDAPTKGLYIIDGIKTLVK